LEYSYWAIDKFIATTCPGKWMGQVASGYNKVVAIDLEYLHYKEWTNNSKSIATTLLQPLGP